MAHLLGAEYFRDVVMAETNVVRKTEEKSQEKTGDDQEQIGEHFHRESPMHAIKSLSVISKDFANTLSIGLMIAYKRSLFNNRTLMSHLSHPTHTPIFNLQMWDNIK